MRDLVGHGVGELDIPDELGVFWTAAATPWLPLPPMPLPSLSTGHSTDGPKPTLSAQSWLTEARKRVKISVVPEPSERWTAVMAGIRELAGHSRVQGRDGRIVPLGDRAVVDSNHDVAAEDQGRVVGRQSIDVVDHDFGAGHGRVHLKILAGVVFGLGKQGVRSQRNRRCHRRWLSCRRPSRCPGS